MSMEHRLAGEMKATADSLRQVRTALAKLIYEGKDIASYWPEACDVMVKGLDVAGALERLAAKIVKEMP